MSGPYGSPQEPYRQQPQWSQAGPPPPPKKKSGAGLIILACVGLLIGLFVIVGLFSGSSDDSEDNTAEATRTHISYTPPPPDPEATKRAEAARASQAEVSRQQQEAAAEELRRQTDPATYETVTERDWLLIARDPDAATGRKVHLYGYVTQFDAGTGSDRLRANVGAEQVEYYNLDTNSIVKEGTPGVLDQVVKGDLVSMYIQVDGAYTYSTTMGGETTVPLLSIYVAEVYGSE